MMSITETKHANNISVFNELIGLVKKFKVANEQINVDGLKDVLKINKEAAVDLRLAVVDYAQAVKMQHEAYENLKLVACGIRKQLSTYKETSPEMVDAKSLVRKICMANNAYSISMEEAGLKIIETSKSVKEISNAQLNLDRRLGIFKSLIKALNSIKGYPSQKYELSIAELQSIHRSIERTNLRVSQCAQAITKARLSRYDLLYKFDSGLLDIALETKAYIKEIFGAESKEWRQAQVLEFSRIK